MAQTLYKGIKDAFANGEEEHARKLDKRLSDAMQGAIEQHQEGLIAGYELVEKILQEAYTAV